jgi:hypothetical protein
VKYGGLKILDRAVWVGDPDQHPIGSSGKVRQLAFTADPQPGVAAEQAYVDWGGGVEGWADIGIDVVSCETAGKRDIAPWNEVYPP